MGCQSCGSFNFAVVADLGGQVLMRCVCGKTQLRRKQEPRGAEWRDGRWYAVVEVTGEIEVVR
jgi:hypothetical protein